MSELLAGLEAVDALNSWVRSRSGRNAFESPQRRIYEAKRMALLDATRLLDAKHYRLVVPAKCRDCGGSGKYCDGWRQFDHCHRCSNSGWVKLEFVESRIGERFCWHSPRDKAWDLPIVGELSWASSEWDVNRPGRDLTPDEAAGHLLVIDAIWPPRHRNSHGHCFEYCDCTDRYSLYLGAWTEYCAHCRGREAQHRFHKRVGRVEFILLACEACYVQRKGLDLFDAPMPWELIQPRNIMAWVNANKGLIERRAA